MSSSITVLHVIFPCSGEGAFHAMMIGFGWAKHPMIRRIHLLDKSVPMTLMYGAKSWVKNLAVEIAMEKRTESYVRDYVRNHFNLSIDKFLPILIFKFNIFHWFSMQICLVNKKMH